MKRWITPVLCAALLAAVPAKAQNDSAESGTKSTDEKVTEVSGKVDGLEESYLETKSTVGALSKIKISGYIQSQYRYAPDTMGNTLFKTGDYAGGAFPDHSQGQFQIRRGRFAIQYDGGISLYKLQLDCTPSGVAIKDVFAQLTEPMLKSFGMRAGVMDRPFGFEVGYSSGSLESPERARIMQVLFPGEMDLGVSLFMKPGDKVPEVLKHFNFNVGLYDGNGIAVETDNSKDVIGRLGFTLPLNDLNLEIDGGVSGYAGNVTCTDTTSSTTKGTTWSKIDSSYAVSSTSGAIARKHDTTWNYTLNGQGYEYEMNGSSFVKSGVGELNQDFRRTYGGADLQIYYDLPVIGGLSLRGEYIAGTQPGTKGSSGFYSPGRNSKEPVYLRQFSGYYITWIQNLGKIFQAEVKYDVYDPNTGLTGDQITQAATASGLSASDLKYTTIGGGLIYHYSPNLKFTVYYEKVTNETVNADVTTASLVPYKSDLKDNVLTVRAQVKF